MKNLSYEEILELVIKSGSDDIKLFKGEFDGGIWIQQVPEEIAGCLSYFIQNNIQVKTYIECGAASGGTVWLINYVLEPEKIYLIDDNKHPRWVFRKEILKDVEYEEFIGDSKSEELLTFLRERNVQPDLILIDTDHHYESTKIETENLSKIGPKALFLYHDTKCCHGVRQYIEEEIEKGRMELIKDFSVKLGLGLYKRCV